VRLELDLQPALDWFWANLPWSLAVIAAAWYWVVGQSVRLARRRRPHWFGPKYERDGNAMMIWSLSPFLPAIAVGWVALWAVTLAAVPSPWSWWRSE
jgi:hypothetical protein